MVESILQKDRELLIFLNNLGSEQYDGFWLTITNQFTWAPLFAFILFLIFKYLGFKKGIFTFLFLVLLVAFSDQFTNLVKNYSERLRPCNTESLQQLLRTFSYKPGGYSFWSGHASLSSAFTVFIVFLLRNRTKLIYLLFIFPVIFGYSRIYLGVHYPVDVTSGYLTGALIGTVFYLLYKLLFKAVFKEKYS
ncbi:undecaprenyl-diphosphatase [Tenacibaculum sp. MAR_2010_89]|uniref:phosphatase PAP2 family protein n=1 Tax=Tenacibaculum sp. MAR_2010_89 TaxID=1250198 RepID=UPI00089C544A|nr:phosphatase PAP2 family protein [Tenacibaculum sp. MAR_2010_89]SED51441.1 undecaprenyl-diphosphatase [Tenacibaculum sp. MAR_2010_89]